MYFSNIPTYLAAFSCYIGALSIMFVIGFPSPTQKELLTENLLDYQTLPIFASISHITRIIGLMSGLLVKIGVNLKTITTVSCMLGVAGYMLIIIASSAAYVIIGIALVGLYTGIVGIFALPYISEMSLNNQRKVMSGGYGFCIRIGLFIAYFSGIWLSFRWLAVFGILQVCIFCFLLMINPESPVWYVRQGLDDKAKSILLYLHGEEFDVDSEIENIKENILNHSWIESVKAMKNWKVLKPMLVMAIIASLKELGGHEALVSFSSHILENQRTIDPKIASLFYPICILAGAIVCITILKYFKLRWLLIIASIFQAISHISMAMYYYVSDNYLHCNIDYSELCQTLAFWPILNIAVFALSFSIGWGIVYYTLIGVMFTLHRELFTGVTFVITNFCSYIVVMIFFYLLQSFGGFLTFLIFSCNYIIAIVFVYFCLDI